jgi:pimeloyl-ACP methyl ester carboxylesterase
MWNSQTIKLDDEHDLHLVQGGEGPDLVLLHGALTTHHDWQAGPAEAFLRDHKVTIVDRPGHGLSRRPRFEGTPREQARQIAEGLGRAGIERALVAGHSFGGLVALAMAEQSAGFVAGLVLVAPLVFPEPRLFEHGLLALRSTPMLGPLFSRMAHGFGIDRPMLDYVQSHMFEPGEMPQRWKASFPYDQVLDPDALVREGEDAASVLPMAPSGLIDLGRIRVPVEIVTGDSDRVIANGLQGNRLAGHLRDARLTGIEGAGHMLHHSHTARLAQIIRSAATASA